MSGTLYVRRHRITHYFIARMNENILTVTAVISRLNKYCLELAIILLYCVAIQRKKKRECFVKVRKYQRKRKHIMTKRFQILLHWQVWLLGNLSQNQIWQTVIHSYPCNPVLPLSNTCLLRSVESFLPIYLYIWWHLVHVIKKLRRRTFDNQAGHEL